MVRSTDKTVGTVTSILNAFKIIYIDGIPHHLGGVERFLEKGQGVKLGDEVVYAFKLNEDGSMPTDKKVLTYLQNIIYTTGFESKQDKMDAKQAAVAAAVTEIDRMQLAGEVDEETANEMRSDIAVNGMPEVSPTDEAVPESTAAQPVFTAERLFGLTCGVNIGNYETFKPTVTGARSPEEAISIMRDFLDFFAEDGTTTHEAIQIYKRRLLPEPKFEPS